MRLCSFAVVVLMAGSAISLSACSSRSGTDAYSKELPNAGQSARTVVPTYQSSAFANPSIAYQQAQTIELRSDIARLPCETLAYEDERLSKTGNLDSPSYEDMMMQLRLLEVRAALYTRCNQPSAVDQRRPQFTVPIEDAMSSEQIRLARQAQRVAEGSNQIVSVAAPITIGPAETTTFVRNSRTSPPAIETAKVGALPELPARAVGSVNASSSINVQNIITPTNTNAGQYKTIEKFGDSVRVKTVSFEDLPLVSGTELTSK